MVQLLGQVLVLVVQNSDMVVQSVDFHLQGSVRIGESRVGVSSSVQLLSQNHDSFLDLSDGSLQVLDLIIHIVVFPALIVIPPLDISVLVPIPLLKALQVFELVPVISILRFQLGYILFNFRQLLLLIGNIIAFLIDYSLKIVYLS